MLGQKGRHFAHNIFKFIFLYVSCSIPIQISLKSINMSLIIKTGAWLVHMLAWRQTQATDCLAFWQTHTQMRVCVCVTRPWWVNYDMLNVELNLR